MTKGCVTELRILFFFPLFMVGITLKVNRSNLESIGSATCGIDGVCNLECFVFRGENCSVRVSTGTAKNVTTARILLHNLHRTHLNGEITPTGVNGKHFQTPFLSRHSHYMIKRMICQYRVYTI